MSAEQLREQIDSAVQQAIADDADIDDIEQTLEDALDRLDAVRAYVEGPA